jgi:RNA polymerase sigma-70 factor (ECF subfamily)
MILYKIDCKMLAWFLLGVAGSRLPLMRASDGFLGRGWSPPAHPFVQFVANRAGFFADIFVRSAPPAAHDDGYPPFMSTDETELARLLERIQRGETDLYLQIVRRHELSLRSYIAGQLYNIADADDIAQDVFITAWRSLDTFRIGEDFGAWLRGIARNRLLIHFRSLQRRASAVEKFQAEVVRIAEHDLEAAARASHGSHLEKLLHCISKLPEKLRRVVHAGLDGARPAAMADELQTTVPAIYQLHYRANQLLRDCMTKEAQS